MKAHVISDDEKRGIQLDAETPEELKILGEIHHQIFEGKLLHWGFSPRSYQFLLGDKKQKCHEPS